MSEREISIRALRRIARRRPVILGYHGIAETPRSRDLFMLLVPPARFRRLIRAMQRAGFRFVTVAELVEHARGGEIPPGMAAISFDDALANNLTAALPILQALGVPATVYVPTGWLGAQNPWIEDEEQGRTLTADELRELHAAGWELGAHTLHHADLPLLDHAEKVAEIRGSMDALQELTGAPTKTLAYPFGRYDQDTIAAAREAGLRGAVTTGSGIWAPFELTRAMIGAADPFPVVILKMLDLYEPLLQAPPLRLARSLSKSVRRSVIARRTERAGPAGS